VRKIGNIVRYTVEEIDAMIARGEDQTDWARVRAKTEEELAADMASDPAWDGVPEDWFEHAYKASGWPVMREQDKCEVTVRLDADVIDHFKGQGGDWESRINAALRVFVDREIETTAPKHELGERG
jgi:uncharacterized protein (DUF4415 family)